MFLIKIYKNFLIQPLHQVISKTLSRSLLYIKYRFNICTINTAINVGNFDEAVSLFSKIAKTVSDLTNSP